MYMLRLYLSDAFFELQKNELKQLKRLTRAQNYTPHVGVQFRGAAYASERLNSTAARPRALRC